MVEVLERQAVLDAIEEVFKYRHSDTSTEDLIFVRQAIRELPSYDVDDIDLEDKDIYCDNTYEYDNEKISKDYHEALDSYIDNRSDAILQDYKESLIRPKFDFED